MEIRVHTKTIAVRMRTGCGQELSGMNQEWSGMTSLKNCWVIAGNCCLKTKLLESAGRTVWGTRITVNARELT